VNEVKDKSIVTIKPLAYFKMLLHVLRFGSKVMNRNKFNEVMGVLIGRLEGEEEIKNVIVEDAIPVSHGGSIEVEFSPEQLGAFGQLDNDIWEKYGDLGWFSVGWYHSHPGLTIFFSGTDIKNQMFWQGRNPSGIGIVFDHNYLETDNDYRKAHNIKKMLNPGEIDYGFRTFRLVDPSSIASKWYEVETIVELPDSLEFYAKIVELIDKVHTKDNFILELNETPDIFGNVNIPYPDQLMANRYDINFDKLISTFKESISEFIDSAFNPLFMFLNKWSQEMVSKVLTNNTQIRDSLIKLKDILSSKISKIQRNFKSSLSYKLDEINGYVFDRIERFDKEFESIQNNVNNLKKELEEQFMGSFEQIIKPSIEQLEMTVEENGSIITNLNDAQSRNKQKIANLQSFIEDISNNIITNKETIINDIKSSSDKIVGLVSEKINISSESINITKKQVDECYSDVENVNAKIETSSKSLSNLKEQVKDLSIKNESLQNKLKVLDGDNPELLEKIENFSALESEKKDLENKVNDLSSKNATLEQENGKLENEKSSIQKDLDMIRTEKNSLENQINELKNSNVQIEEKYNTLESEKLELENKVQAFEEESKKGKKKKKDKKKK